MSAVTRALPVRGKISALIKNTGVKFFQSAYSQSQELEADAFGVKLMKASGYDPLAAIEALKRLAACHNNNGPRTIKEEYFSTHPGSEARIQAIRDML
jgi:putative metalloprotease